MTQGQNHDRNTHLPNADAGSRRTDRVATHLRTRIVSMLALIATVGIGLWCRSSSFSGTPFVAQHLGTLLWAVAVHWTIRTLMPRLSVLRVSALTLLIAWAIELLQITPISRTLSSWHPLLRLIFGSSFDLRDMLALAVGVGVAAGLNALRSRIG